jgi:hypothetical protein
MSRSCCTFLLLAIAALLGAPVAHATDGVIEINAAKAAVGGVGPGDTSGFPVTLDAAGSYRLTSDLDPADPDTTAIEITSPNVTLDLGGFAVANSCGQACGAGAGFGIHSTARSTTVKNGRVSGAGADGISLLQVAARVEDVDASFNVGRGIAVSQGSVRRASATGNYGDGVSLDFGLLEDSELTANGGNGARLGAGVGYARNVFAGNSVSVSGGHATGGNVCSDKRCSTTGARRFYLTTTDVIGNQALTACVAGFHMASLWEIAGPSALFYDPVNGRQQPDSGQGPPANLNGWVRTGTSGADTTIGTISCLLWTADSVTGSTIRLNESWFSSDAAISPWIASPAACDVPFPVWCVED